MKSGYPGRLFYVQLSFPEWLSFFYFLLHLWLCFESAYVSLKNRHLTNRGFLKGPWLPLYGSGAILVLWLTLPFQETPALVYVVGALAPRYWNM